MHVFNSKNIYFIYCTYFSYKSSNIFFVVVNLHQNTWKQSSSRGHECLKKYLKILRIKIHRLYQNISFYFQTVIPHMQNVNLGPFNLFFFCFKFLKLETYALISNSGTLFCAEWFLSLTFKDLQFAKREATLLFQNDLNNCQKNTVFCSAVNGDEQKLQGLVYLHGTKQRLFNHSVLQQGKKELQKLLVYITAKFSKKNL